MKQSYTDISIIKLDTTEQARHEYYFHSAHTAYGDAFVFKTWLEFYPPKEYQLKPDAPFFFGEVLTHERDFLTYTLHRHFVMLDDTRASTIMQILDHLNWHSNVLKRYYKLMYNPFMYNPHLSPELPF